MSFPVEEGADVSIGSDAERAFFLRCCELYRVLELADRRLDSMIETYSKYRTREPFKETLAFRYFDEANDFTGIIDAELDVLVVAMFNMIHELRVSLMHEDALPYTVKTRIESALSILKKEWNEIVPKLQKRYSWRLKRLSA